MAEFENENVMLGEDIGDFRERNGYSAGECKCGYTLYIKRPKIKAFHSIKCPNCGFVVNLFCGSEGEKLGMHDICSLGY